MADVASKLHVARSELILGGQRSGKSRRAESLAVAWLAQSATHRAVFIATAQAWDEEMRERIAQHQRDRAERLPRMVTMEEPLELAEAIARHSRSDTLVVVDCLTLWLTNWLMPGESPHPSPLPEGEGAIPDAGPEVGSLSPWERARVRAPRTQSLLAAIQFTLSPLILVSNEIGLGVIPLGSEVRSFVDALGRLNQDVAQACKRVTLMAAGLPLALKDTE